MGVKGSKYFEKKMKSDSEKLGPMTKEELTACLATVSHMAHTGVVEGLPEIRINDEPPEAAFQPEMLQNVKRRMRQRLQRQMSTNQEQALSEHVHKQLELLDSLESKDDSSDWADMRAWLVWCLHSNLDDILPAQESPSSTSSSPASSTRSQRRGRSHLHRQLSLDKGGLRLVHQGSSSFDSNHSGKMSGQNSFDSSGATAES